MIYLDNAATSWPKPEAVYAKAADALRSAANPGRGGHRFSRQAAKIVLEARETVASFFGVGDCRQIIFTSGATESLNMVIFGLAPQLTRVVSTGSEHNAVWRPLESLARQHGVQVDYVDVLSPAGGQDLDRALAASPQLVVVNHGSNVTGQIYPLQEIIARAQNAGAMVLADISQTAGVVSLNLSELGVDFAAFPGHKGLFGPPGVGGLYIRPGLELNPLRLGGTGGNSQAAQMPDVLPERFESGTMNLPGIAGLAAGVQYIAEYGVDAIYRHEMSLRSQAARQLEEAGATVYQARGNNVGVLSFNLPGVDSGDVAFMLDEMFGIAVRGGLHCSPRTHQTLGTINQGAVRLSPGLFNTAADIDRLVEAIGELQKRNSRNRG